MCWFFTHKSEIFRMKFSSEISMWGFALEIPHLRFPCEIFLQIRHHEISLWDFSTENSLWDFHLRFSCEILHLRSSTWDPTVRFCTQDPRFPLRIPLRSSREISLSHLSPWDFPWTISPREISPEIPLRFPLPITAVSKQPFPAAACLPRRVVRRRHDATRAWRETFNH